eukprot:TRINITY_DN7697_c0_g1_i1.p1 TRINITY_DN7697_c0_g1~~TRINITY_DN7697_c0_g1_i1.p1  ORF type:complete len:320 (+),score=84.51 TRINITY_DN7697_c0_g1_i1:70-1029(+)
MDPSRYSGRLKEIFSLFESLTKEVEEKIETLKEKEDHLAEVKQKVDESIARANEEIDINIGGKRISTSKSSLLSVQGSFFHAMLSSEQWKPNSRGEYFIDREYTYFPRIITLLRTGRLELDGLSNSEVEKLNTELEYYQIPNPYHQNAIASPISQFQPNSPPSAIPWKWNSQKKGEKIVLSNEDKTALKTSLVGWNAVLGNRSINSFKIKIIKTNGQVMIGMAPLTVNLNRDDSRSCGWYLNIGDGSLHSQNGDKARPYTTSIKENSIVQVDHDREKKTISFSINGQNKGIAYQNISSNLVLYPCVGIVLSENVVEIVE